MPLSPEGENLENKNSDHSYIQHSIFAGNHYSDKNDIRKANATILAFKVKFDSTAIYTTVDPVNQTDINKLFGFSDNNAAHHQYSARFGWRWSENALRLFGYTYNAGRRSFKELGTVRPGVENECSISVYENNYIFSLNGSKTSMPRESKTEEIAGYQLYPYFGGDEVAPHDIFIWIKEFAPPEEKH